jgi:hypothetical protein
MHDATRGQKQKTRNGAAVRVLSIDVLSLDERHLTRTYERTTTHAGETLVHRSKLIPR